MRKGVKSTAVILYKLDEFLLSLSFSRTLQSGMNPFIFM